MSELAPSDEETGGSDWVEPRTDDPPKLELVTGPGEFAETPEMASLRERILGGEAKNLDLWTSYYEMGTTLTDAEGGSALAKLEFQLAFAEMKITTDYLADARGDLEQLTWTPEIDEYPEFGRKVFAALGKITSTEP